MRLNLELWLKPDMSVEDAELLTDMGYAFENGQTFQQDYEAAIQCYEAAVRFQNQRAVNNLGWLLLNGFGAKKDVSRAAALFRQAADAGIATAMVNLGNLHEEGLLTGEPDYKQAFFWYKKAADEDDYKGLFNYANCFHHGWGTRKNRKKAFAIFSELAEWDDTDPSLCFYMGLYHQEGYAAKRDYTLAREWYQKGAEQGDVYCVNQLGVLYARGLGVSKDLPRAMELYQRAAELVDTLSCVNVGWLYESSREFKNMDKAIEWYRKGAAKGEEHCIDALRRIKEN